MTSRLSGEGVIRLEFWLLCRSLALTRFLDHWQVPALASLFVLGLGIGLGRLGEGGVDGVRQGLLHGDVLRERAQGALRLTLPKRSSPTGSGARRPRSSSTRAAATSRAPTGRGR